MTALDELRAALDDAKEALQRLAAAVDAADRYAADEAHRQEVERLTALTLAMSPAVPPLVGDHVPVEWLGTEKESTDD